MLGSKTMIRFFLAVLITIWIAPVYADVNLEEYEAVKGTDSFKLYISGVGAGYYWANIHLAIDRKLSPIYCQPGKVGLNANNYLQILDNYLSQPETKASTSPTSPLGLILLFALRDTFPCK